MRIVPSASGRSYSFQRRFDSAILDTRIERIRATGPVERDDRLQRIESDLRTTRAPYFPGSGNPDCFPDCCLRSRKQTSGAARVCGRRFNGEGGIRGDQERRFRDGIALARDNRPSRPFINARLRFSSRDEIRIGEHGARTGHYDSPYDTQLIIERTIRACFVTIRREGEHSVTLIMRVVWLKLKSGR